MFWIRRPRRGELFVDFGGKIKIRFVFEETLTFVEVLEGTPLKLAIVKAGLPFGLVRQCHILGADGSF